jgi:hypothetical protein
MTKSLAILVCFVLFLGPVCVFGGETHMLYCRGGGPIKAQYLEIIPRPYRAWGETDSHWFRKLTTSFVRAPQAAGLMPPPPGAMAFAQRPVQNSEPNVLYASWSEKDANTKRKSRPGEWISGLNITPTSIKVSGVQGSNLKFLLDGIQRSNMVFGVKVTKETIGSRVYWKVLSLGNNFHIANWPPPEIRPDLVVSKIIRISRSPQINHPTIFDVTFKNVGAYKSDVTDYAYRVGGGSLKKNSLPALDINQEWTTRINIPPLSKAQKYRFYVVANPDNSIKEVTRSNNERNSDFTIKK